MIVDIDDKLKDKRAIIWRNNSITYRELIESALKFSERLFSGTIVGICFDDPIKFTQAYLGVLYSGGVVALINNEYKKKYVEKQLEYCDCSILLTDKEELLEDMNIPSFELDDIENILYENKSPILDEVAVLIQTSGSDSDPKIVQLTHEGLIWVAQAHNKHLKLNESNVNLIILPLTSSFAHTTLFLSQLIMGGTIVIESPPVSPKRIYSLINEHSINTMGCVPTHLKLMRIIPPNEQEVKSLEYVVCAGAHTSNSDIITLKRYFTNTVFLKAYGLTEAGPRVTCTRPDSEDIDSDSSGIPLQGVQVKIKSSKIKKNADVIGEILVKSPGLMKGYYKNKINNIRDGWLYTGDLGKIDNNNRLVVIGRKKNTVLVGGRTVYLEEVEEILKTAEYIKDAALIGVPGQNLWGKNCGFSCTIPTN